MKTTFSITYYCRPSKQNKQGQSPIEMCITVNGERLFINLPAKLSPKVFNKKRKPQHIENLLTQFSIKVNDVMAMLMSDGQPITARTIRDYIQTGGTKTYTVKDVCNDFIKNIGNHPDRVYKYQLVSDFLTNELGADKQLSSITPADCSHLYDILKEKYLLSTAAGYMSKVKTMLTFAFDNGKIKTNPSNQIKINKGKPTIGYLSEGDMNKIKNVDLTEYPKLDKVRDLLLFQCNTGVAYADLILFNPSKIELIDGVPTYTSNRQKTGIEFTCVVLNDAMAVLYKYNNVLPIISNQKYNKYLKELQQLSGVSTLITTHLCRKTYAHHLLNNGVRIETVARLLGHSNTTITQRCYCRKTTNTIASEVGNIMKGGLI